jgi:N4-gp56 family major capsid protein
MAAVTRNDVSATGILQEKLNRAFLPNLDANLVFLQYAEKPDFADYQTLRWAKFTDFAETDLTTGTTSTDGVTPSDTAITITSTTVTPTQYRIVVSLSDMLLERNPMPLLQKVAERIAYVMAKKMDSVIQTTIMAGTNVLYSGTNAARTDIGAGEGLVFNDLNRAVSKLQSVDAPTFEDGLYRAVVHPLVAYDIKNSTAAGSWLDVAKYNTPNKIERGELGSIFGARVIMSSHINTFTSTVTVYPTLVFGRGAFGVGMAQQPQVFITPAGSSDSDPAAQRRKVAGKVAFGTVILEQNAIVRLESSATAL